MNVTDDRRALVDLLPRFLMRATRGWDGLAPLLASAGLDRPAFFLLRALVQERDDGDAMTRAEMDADLFNPYHTLLPLLDTLPRLVEQGYVRRSGERYIVTPGGRSIVARIDEARDAYLASLAPIPAADLARLTATLMEIARRLRDAPEPPGKPHQARAWRVIPSDDAAPLVRLYGAVYALWMARDDAHNAAWRAAGFDGPTFDLMSRVWSGEARATPALIEAVRQFQQPDDVTDGIASLVAAGYLTQSGDALSLTTHGAETRERIETETDRLFFIPWPPFSSADSAWLRATVTAVIAGFPSEPGRHG